ncbi:class I SAM-dependent methyltransferase [Burkholderia sp. Bp9125]|nr:class I SAM-dependent methyltransferase [Burkholderia sp. Bp9125]
MSQTTQVHDVSGYLNKSAMVRMAEYFDDLATGRTQVPRQPVQTRIRDSISDRNVLAYHDLMISNAGPLFSHFLASVPCILEEMSRVGVALTRLSQKRANNGRLFSFYEIDGFDGSNGRTLAKHSDGLIRTLTSSPNKANEIHFNRFADHSTSKFHAESFLCVNRYVLDERADLHEFRHGFDYLYETAAFQFYGQDRENQIGHVASLLKDDGLAFFLEKLNHADPTEYNRREQVKDNLHKSHYFTPEEIEWKRQQMLSQMHNGQVSFDELIKAIHRHFQHVYLIWNSTNFYEFVASNNEENLETFVGTLGKPYLAEEFRFENPFLRKVTGHPL